VPTAQGGSARKFEAVPCVVHHARLLGVSIISYWSIGTAVPRSLLLCCIPRNHDGWAPNQRLPLHSSFFSPRSFFVWLNLGGDATTKRNQNYMIAPRNFLRTRQLGRISVHNMGGIST